MASHLPHVGVVTEAEVKQVGLDKVDGVVNQAPVYLLLSFLKSHRHDEGTHVHVNRVLGALDSEHMLEEVSTQVPPLPLRGLQEKVKHRLEKVTVGGALQQLFVEPEVGIVDIVVEPVVEELQLLNLKVVAREVKLYGLYAELKYVAVLH